MEMMRAAAAFATWPNTARLVVTTMPSMPAAFGSDADIKCSLSPSERFYTVQFNSNTTQVHMRSKTHG